jgi:hypothetical protein
VFTVMRFFPTLANFLSTAFYFRVVPKTWSCTVGNYFVFGCRRLGWARYLRCLSVSPRRYAVFTVLTGAFRLCRVSNIGDGSVVEPNHVNVA